MLDGLSVPGLIPSLVSWNVVTAKFAFGQVDLHLVLRELVEHLVHQLQHGLMGLSVCQQVFDVHDGVVDVFHHNLHKPLEASWSPQ